MEFLFPDVLKALKQLKQDGHTLSICSNGSLEYIKLVMQTTGITDFFDDICSAKQFASKTDAVKKIVERNPTAVMVGDTFSDIKAARENHIPSIGVTYGYGQKKGFGTGDISGARRYGYCLLGSPMSCFLYSYCTVYPASP